jgi:hypothetical protein
MPDMQDACRAEESFQINMMHGPRIQPQTKV